MNQKVNLSHRIISTIIPDFTPMKVNYGNNLQTNNEFGWNVNHAEIQLENGIIESFKLIGKDGECICKSEKIKNESLVYWCIEYKIRDLNYSPDIFEPNPLGFLEFYYCQITDNEAVYKTESYLPVVIYKTRENDSISEIRYSLNLVKEKSNPIIDIHINKSGYLNTITDNQDSVKKHIAYPTPEFTTDYLLQKFGNKKGDNIYNRMSNTNLIEKELTFKGFREFKVKYLVDNETEKEFYSYGFFQNELRSIINNAEIILSFIPTINYHLIKPCNMKCKHCFSEFGEIEINSLSLIEAFRIIDEIVKIPTFKKINFSGGEPTMYKGIEKLIEYAKKIGLETSLVSNTYHLIQSKAMAEKILQNLDLLAFSIDSFENELNLQIGRSVGKKTISFEKLSELAEECHLKNVKIKVNTVVTKLNCNTIIADKISHLKPIRWKILRMLPIENQNNKAIDLIPTDDDFRRFLNNNVKIAEENGVKVVAEDNFEMRGSYLMISPDGRFFNNADYTLNYSGNILDIGIHHALSQTPLLREIFYKREGNYSCE